ncbi:tyrosine-type recombinase/integrase [endosymbiont GvMRE of Glomus versiforme]|uniref:tyrosine-type recombinase/integrase n=1 Tax=endosymbiont GvMRE of Glomus versiforme TaxID=2039283 RepID=UPI000EC401B0|nr:tyrosine-type recombinase/integrase [endosymbiont GvMRE of Glomus versiforme]RHZ37716.1 Tyrosine recombinase XerC [endosymbiont GvMRE of Glomus versiforme]
MNLTPYQLWLQNQHISLETIRNYTWTIKQYDNQLTTEQIIQFLQANQKKYEPSTLRNQKIALASYAKFQKKEIEWKKICRVIPTVQKKFYTTINEKELQKLKAVRFEKHEWQYQRNNLILDFLFYSGLRVKELTNIQHHHWQENSLRIHGKGNKVRYVFLPNFLIKYFQPYSKDYLFLTSRNKKFTETWIRIMIKRKVEKAGIIKNITPHTFRRSLATNLYNKGGRLETIQKQLGHSSSDTTMGYIHNDHETLYQDYSRIFEESPRHFSKSLKDYSTKELLTEISRRVGGQYA